MSFWEKINPFKREIHCHVPLLAGRAEEMDKQGGIVDGMVDHPDDESEKFIEFVGIVLDHDLDPELHDQFGLLLEEAKKVLREGVRQIQNKSEVAEDNQILESFSPETDIFTEMGKDHSVSFWEDDSARITAYGHRDKKEFAEEVQSYDIYCEGSDSLHDEADITHRWGLATVKHGELCIVPCNQYHPKGFPITTIWSAR